MNKAQENKLLAALKESHNLSTFCEKVGATEEVAVKELILIRTMIADILTSYQAVLNIEAIITMLSKKKVKVTAEEVQTVIDSLDTSKLSEKDIVDVMLLSRQSRNSFAYTGEMAESVKFKKNSDL